MLVLGLWLLWLCFVLCISAVVNTYKCNYCLDNATVMVFTTVVALCILKSLLYQFHT